jgi:hypothetical protein
VNLCNVNSKELIQLCWDPGGVNNSGLGASHTSSGGEYHELGCHVTLWAETGLPKWAGLKDSRYKKEGEHSERASIKNIVTLSSSCLRVPLSVLAIFLDSMLFPV